MIKKSVYGSIPAPYSMLVVPYRGKQLCLSASENNGGDILITEMETGKARKISDLPGGIMSIVPVPDQEGCFMAITQFYPIFKSENAEIVMFKLLAPSDDYWPIMVKSVCNLPFVHRIALTRLSDGYRLLGSTLCSEKAFTDDWTHPGGVYIYQLNDDFETMSHKELLSGLTKNHGMFVDGNEVYVSAQEGVWCIDLQNNSYQVTDVSISDLIFYDVDEDGEKELICISPFHGNSLRILKNIHNEWSEIYRREIDFGHALWCGKYHGKPSIVVCNRGGEKKTELLSFNMEKTLAISEEQIIDCGAGATNLAVFSDGDAIAVYCANHAANEVACYYVD